MVTKPTSRKTVLDSPDTYKHDTSVKNGCKDMMVHALTKYKSDKLSSKANALVS